MQLKAQQALYSFKLVVARGTKSTFCHRLPEAQKVLFATGYLRQKVLVVPPVTSNLRPLVTLLQPLLALVQRGLCFSNPVKTAVPKKKVKPPRDKGGLTTKDFLANSYVNHNHGFVLPSQHFHKEI